MVPDYKERYVKMLVPFGLVRLSKWGLRVWARRRGVYIEFVTGYPVMSKLWQRPVKAKISGFPALVDHVFRSLRIGVRGTSAAFPM